MKKAVAVLSTLELISLAGGVAIVFRSDQVLPLSVLVLTASSMNPQSEPVQALSATATSVPSALTKLGIRKAGAPLELLLSFVSSADKNSALLPQKRVCLFDI